MNIHIDKLPIWIYRMRVLGYPPGWLQHATVSTLAIFDGTTEDGELNDSSEAQVQQYNKEALIEYPGFNTPVPEGVRDVLNFKSKVILSEIDLYFEGLVFVANAPNVTDTTVEGSAQNYEGFRARPLQTNQTRHLIEQWIALHLRLHFHLHFFCVDINTKRKISES